MKFIAFLFFFSLFACNQLTGSTPDSSKYPILGIDISHHQGSIDWDELGTDKRVEFVFMKATEGGDFKDRRFKENWNAAKKHHLRYGAYHFWSFCRTGEIQAQNFINTVPLDSKALPPVVDLEFLGSCTKRPPLQEAIHEIQIFLNTLEQHYHKKPILYTTYDFYDVYLKEALLDYNLWIRDVEQEPQLPKHRTWTFWQFSNTGFRKGISGRVDLNAFAGNRQEFENY